MTASEARRDALRRLGAAGIAFDKVTAKTVGFSDLARANAVFVDVVTRAPFDHLQAAFAGHDGYVARACGAFGPERIG